MDAPWTVTHVERPNRPAGGLQTARRVTEALVPTGAGVLLITRLP